LLATTHASTPSSRGIGWACVTGVILALWLQAPAQWMSYLVASATNQQVLLKDARGSIWKGSAQAVLSPPNVTSTSTTQSALSSRLAWSIRLTHDGWLPALGVQLHADCCTVNDFEGSVKPTWSGIEFSLKDHTSSWPASWLSGLGAPWNTLQPQGLIQISTQQARWQSSQPLTFSGQINLQLKELSTQLSTIRPLGSYEVVILGGSAPQMTLRTLEGSLLLSGQGQWANRRFRFQGEAEAKDGAESALSNLLNVLGQRRGKVSILNMS
jgi:general secretion pathway protein N